MKSLFDNLTLPEYRTRYRTRRELRSRDPSEVLAALDLWIVGLDSNSENHELHLLEALWVSWGLNQVNTELLEQLLSVEDFRVRAAAVRVLRYNPQLQRQIELLTEAATDPHGRVRTEAMAAASWLSPEVGLPIVEQASQDKLDKWNMNVSVTALAHLQGQRVPVDQPEEESPDLNGPDLALYTLGKEIYARDGYCSTCHRPDGKGLPASGFPPLADTDWVLGDSERLIKLTLDGLMGTNYCPWAGLPGTSADDAVPKPSQ